MADKQQQSQRKSVFKRYSLLEAVAEIINDNDSGEEDFEDSTDIDSEEEETDCFVWFYVPQCMCVCSGTLIFHKK